MAAVPVYDYEPIDDDPAEILRSLPREYRDHFLSEYRTALDMAREVEHYRDLHLLLRRWHLLAVAMSRPGFSETVQGVHDSSRAGRLDGTLTLDEVIAARAQLR